MIRTFLTLCILFVRWVDKTEHFATFVWRMISIWATEFPEMRRERARFLKELRKSGKKPSDYIMHNDTIIEKPQDIEVLDTNNYWCPECKEETVQICKSGGHERDSSQDSRECTKCGKVGFGLTGFDRYL